MSSSNRYLGCFLGLAIGDAYGAPFEGGPIERLMWKLIGKTKEGLLRYTDDTQMAMDVATSYLENGAINQERLAKTFSANYRWSRGYGPRKSGISKQSNCNKRVHLKRWFIFLSCLKNNKIEHLYQIMDKKENSLTICA